MRLMKTCFAAAAALLAAGSAWAQTEAQGWARYPRASEVQLRDVAGFVRVTPQDRRDVAVAVTNPGPLPTPEARVVGDRLVIDGKLRRQIRSCRVRGAHGFEVRTRRQGEVADALLPVVELRVPQDAVLSVSGAVRLHMGPAQSARVRLDGCGDADLEQVAGEADIAVSGAPDVRLYDTGSARIAVAGAGDVTLGVVRSGLTVSIAGAGDVIAGRADGPTNIAIQGAGDVVIRDGRATTLSVAVAGAGDVTHNGVAERLDAAILGSGDVRVRRVEGQVTRRIMGAGDVIVGR
jgi:hypothetical protein